MKLLIDMQKSVEVNASTLTDGDGNETLVIPFSDAHAVLTAWKDLDLAHRNFTYGNQESDNTPSIIVTAWVDGTGALSMNHVGPFWDGSFEQNAYSLEALVEALPIDSVLWGARIGEPA